MYSWYKEEQKRENERLKTQYEKIQNPLKHKKTSRIEYLATPRKPLERLLQKKLSPEIEKQLNIADFRKSLRDEESLSRAKSRSSIPSTPLTYTSRSLYSRSARPSSAIPLSRNTARVLTQRSRSVNVLRTTKHLKNEELLKRIRIWAETQLDRNNETMEPAYKIEILRQLMNSIQEYLAIKPRRWVKHFPKKSWFEWNDEMVNEYNQLIYEATLDDAIQQRLIADQEIKEKYQKLHREIRAAFKVQCLKNYTDRILTSESQLLKRKLKHIESITQSSSTDNVFKKQSLGEKVSSPRRLLYNNYMDASDYVNSFASAARSFSKRKPLSARSSSTVRSDNTCLTDSSKIELGVPPAPRETDKLEYERTFEDKEQAMEELDKFDLRLGGFDKKKPLKASFLKPTTVSRLKYSPPVK